MFTTSELKTKPKTRAFQNVSPVIQPKLKIGTPNDRFEHQADRVADSVMTMPDQPLQMEPLEEEEELQMQPMEEQEEIQMKCKECEERKKLQMSTDNTSKHRTDAPVSFSKKIAQSNGSGQKLPNHLNLEMSNKMGVDFSDVLIHHGNQASEMSREIGARAFTHGNDIYFNSGEYKPATSKGKHLLAHELTHVVQQARYSGTEPDLQRTIDGQFRVEWRNKIDSEIKDRGNAYAIAIVSGISHASMPSRFDDSVNTFLSELQTNLGKYALSKMLENVPGGGAMNSAIEAMIATRKRIEAHNIEDAFESFREHTRSVLLAGVDNMTDSDSQFNQQLQNIILRQAEQDPRFNDPPSGTEDADQYARDMQMYIQQEVNHHMFGRRDADFSHLIANVNDFIERSFQYFILARAEVMAEYNRCMGRQTTEGSVCDEGIWVWERYPRECRHEQCEQWLTYAPMPPNWTGPQPRQEHLGMCMNQPCTWFTVSSGVEHPGGRAHVRENELDRQRQRFRSE